MSVRLIRDPEAHTPLFMVRYWVPTNKLSRHELNGLKPGTAEVVRTFGIVQADTKEQACRLAAAHESMPKSATRVAAYPADESETPLFLPTDPHRREAVKRVREAV